MSNQPKNLQDCYFYYYSVCRKGTSCPYRHEPTALGHERMCLKWSEGQCANPHCPERHMVIEKARNQIQCYWEQKPTGCRKPHCVFKHLNTNTIQIPAAPGIIAPVNTNVTAAIIQMQQQQQLQHHIQQQQQQHLHPQSHTSNNNLNQAVVDK